MKISDAVDSNRADMLEKATFSPRAENSSVFIPLLSNCSSLLYCVHSMELVLKYANILDFIRVIQHSL